MGMTMIEKTLAAAAKEDVLQPGDIIFPNVSLITGTDVVLPRAHEVLADVGISQVFDKDKIAVFTDFYNLSNDTDLLSMTRRSRDFARDHHIDMIFPEGRGGVAHITSILEGLAVPGDLVVTGDSHGIAYGGIGSLGIPVGSTDLAVALALGQLWMEVPETIQVTFTGEPDRFITGRDLGLALLRTMGPAGAINKAIEFSGDALAKLSVPDRLTLADMAMNVGAVTAIVPPDQRVIDYLAERSKKEANYHFADDDAEYTDTIEISVEELEPMIQNSNKPESIFGISAVEDTREVDTVVIGGCSGGQIEDFWLAAKVMKYRHVHDDVRLIIIPATNQTFQQMINEGLASIFIELGASIWPPGCSFCSDSTMNILSSEETALFTSAGAPYQSDATVFSASVPLAAASAVNGYMTNPGTLIEETETTMT